MVKFAFVLIIFLVFLQYYGLGWNITYLALPAILVVQLLLIAGCTFLLASIVPFIPDIMQLVNYALTLLLFLSGIFYSVDSFPEQYQAYFYLNPMVSIIEAYRDVMLYSQWPDLTSLSIVAAVSILMIVAGAWIMSRYERVYPRVVL